jgi:hypothetical protein
MSPKFFKNSKKKEESDSDLVSDSNQEEEEEEEDGEETNVKSIKVNKKYDEMKSTIKDELSKMTFQEIRDLQNKIGLKK